MTNHRSAITGEFVTAEHAAANLDTTVGEQRTRRPASDCSDLTNVAVVRDRAGYPRGWLYRVEPLGSLTPSNDPLPSWGTPSARVVSVYERAVGMTPKQVRSFMRRVEREAS